MEAAIQAEMSQDSTRSPTPSQDIVPPTPPVVTTPPTPSLKTTPTPSVEATPPSLAELRKSVDLESLRQPGKQKQVEFK